jgi:hypothetical protein
MMASCISISAEPAFRLIFRISGTVVLAPRLGNFGIRAKLPGGSDGVSPPRQLFVPHPRVTCAATQRHSPPERIQMSV